MKLSNFTSPILFLCLIASFIIILKLNSALDKEQTYRLNWKTEMFNEINKTNKLIISREIENSNYINKSQVWQLLRYRIVRKPFIKEDKLSQFAEKFKIEKMTLYKNGAVIFLSKK